MSRIIPALILAFAALACSPRLASAQTILRVDAIAAPGGDGLSWLTSFRHLSDALAVAAGGGVDEIRVADGTYFPDRSAASPTGTGNRLATFALPLGVALRGGYAGLGEIDPDLRDPDAYPTNLSGAIGTPAVADNSYHVITAVGPNSANVLDGLRIVDGYANDAQINGGGLLLTGGTLTVIGCHFVDNFAQTRGGGIAGFDATLAASGTRFEGNSSQRGGGAFLDVGVGTFQACEFTDNSATLAGGAIRVEGAGSELEVIGGIFQSNTSSGSSGGGAIHTFSTGPVLLQGVEFIGNATTNGNGGAVHLGSLDWTVIGCTFIGNSSAELAGALDVGGSGDLLDTIFEGNSAFDGGGAIQIFDPMPTHPIVDCHFLANIATDAHGGALRSGGLGVQPGELVLRSCTFESNVANAWGGALHVEGYSVSLEECTFTSNSSQNSGGGALRLWQPANGATYRIEECTFLGNLAPNGPSGAVDLGGPAELVDCWFEGNSAGGRAGAVGCDDDAATVLGCTFLENHAGDQGGGISLFATGPHAVVGCDFIGNTAAAGGGLAYHALSSVGIHRVSHCRFLGNSVIESPTYPNCGGGGAYVERGLDVVFAHCLFSGNVSDRSGGAFRCIGLFSIDHVELAHCTIAGNESTNGAGGVHAEVLTAVTNTIVWGNEGTHPSPLADQLTATVYFGTTSISVDHSCVEGWDGSLPGVGAIALDPEFIDLMGADNVTGTLDDDLRIVPGSSCIDAGSNSAIVEDFADLDGDGDLAEPVPFDLAGLERRVDDTGVIDSGEGSPPIIDIGAYEALVGSGEFRRGDGNDDGLVDIADGIFALAFLFQSGVAPHCAASADSNDDGLIDIGDPIHLLTYLFSSGPPPGSPGDVCGVDPTPDPLDCLFSIACP